MIVPLSLVTFTMTRKWLYFETIQTINHNTNAKSYFINGQCMAFQESKGTHPISFSYKLIFSKLERPHDQLFDNRQSSVGSSFILHKYIKGSLMKSLPLCHSMKRKNATWQRNSKEPIKVVNFSNYEECGTCSK